MIVAGSYICECTVPEYCHIALLLYSMNMVKQLTLQQNSSPTLPECSKCWPSP